MVCVCERGGGCVFLFFTFTNRWGGEIDRHQYPPPPPPPNRHRHHRQIPNIKQILYRMLMYCWMAASHRPKRGASTCPVVGVSAASAAIQSRSRSLSCVELVVVLVFCVVEGEEKG